MDNPAQIYSAGLWTVKDGKEAEFVAAWEGNVLDVHAAIKKPGADRVVLLVKRWQSPDWLPEVWDVG